jgi:hypothetical protein
MERYLSRNGKILQRLAVRHAVPAGRREVTVACTSHTYYCYVLTKKCHTNETCTAHSRNGKPLVDLGTDGRIILKWILEKRVWICELDWTSSVQGPVGRTELRKYLWRMRLGKSLAALLADRKFLLWSDVKFMGNTFTLQLLWNNKKRHKWQYYEQRKAINACDKYLCTKNQCSPLRNRGWRMRTKSLALWAVYVTGIYLLNSRGQ